VIREEFKTLMEIVKMDIPFTVKTIGAFHDLSCVHFVMVCMARILVSRQTTEQLVF
jgi:hypothetical protein